MSTINIMKKIIIFLLCCLTATTLRSQTVYELSFSLPHAAGDIPSRAFFVDHKDGKGKMRIRFIDPVSKDSILAELEAAEDLADANCNEDRLWYKLSRLSYIDSRDPAIPLPAYLSFRKDATNGLFEPWGLTNDAKDCNAASTRFTGISMIEPKDLTKEFVLTWFKPYDLFYRNLFVTNNTRALTMAERNIKLYLLFVANVTDAKIGIADRKNMNEAIAFFRKIKDHLGIDQFLYDTVAGANYSKATVEQKLKTFLTPGPNDIVVFYYSGHGYRQPKDGRPGPYIDLRIDYKKSYLVNSLSMEDIRDIIVKKGARLNLVLSDCCNAYVTDTNPMVQEQPISGKKGGFDLEWSVQNSRDLFLSTTPTTILATAAEPYQLAISNPIFGGFFSTFFRNAVDSHLSYSKSKVTWTDVFEQAKAQTERKTNRTWCNDAKTIKCGKQRPFVHIQYGRF
jgi:Caspase domain